VTPTQSPGSGRRSEQRQAAVVALYQHSLTGRPVRETLSAGATPFVVRLASEAAERSAELDDVISRHAHGWSVDRIHPLERAIMSVALVEILYPEVVPADTPIPPEGAVEEAVRAAKTFCGADAPGFVNGVLGAVLREVRENAGKP
jgi:N utilization substance protein B